MIFHSDKSSRWYVVMRNGNWYVADSWLHDTMAPMANGPCKSREEAEALIADLKLKQIREMGS